MAFKLCFLLLLLSVFVLSVFCTRDPELKECKSQCEEQRYFDERQRQECKTRCEEKERGRGDEELSLEADPERKLQQCQTRCESFRGQESQLCKARCMKQYGKEREQERDASSRKEDEREQEQEQEQEREQEREQEGENPYVFEEEHFQTRLRSEHGKFDVLQRFNKRSNLLRGLENYRLEVLEANPQTLVLPKHVDAEGLYFVAKGRATITKILQNKRESHNLERGDLIRIEAGVPTYVINRDEHEKLYIIKLLRPVNIPDQYEVFFGAGGRNPESFFNAFSSEILEAAFKTDRSTIERIFRQQNDGAILKASKQQIEAMSRHEEGGSIWPFPAGETWRTGKFSLFKKKATESNDYGEVFEVDSSEFRALRDLNVQVAFANITKGSMMGPLYNSKATKIAMVVRGEGYFEMACPHVSSSSRQHSSSPSYHKIKSRLKVGTVYIVPAGHPVVAVSSKTSNLEVLCLDVNAQGNVRYPLAGKGNIWNLMEREAKELAFNTRAQEVDQVFGKQGLRWFFPGPKQQQLERKESEREGRRAYE